MFRTAWLRGGLAVLAAALMVLGLMAVAPAAANATTGGPAGSPHTVSSSSPAGGSPAAPLAQPARPAPKTTPQAHPTRNVCGPTQPGKAACLAVARTDIVGHQGTFAAQLAPAGYGPADLQSAYRLPATAGAGATVAIIDAYDNPNAEADLAVYRKQYGLPPCTTANGCFRKADQRGGTQYPPRDMSWSTEISLDVDMVSAACPLCHILLVEADDAGVANLGLAVDQAVTLGARYVSNSYGATESPSETTTLDPYYQHPGVVVTASSGDSGYGAQYPAASPYVTAVGGTSLVRDTSARGWNDTVWNLSGAGCSSYEAKPSWQKDRCGSRMIGDVAAVADPNTGVAVYDSYQWGGWGVFGGTSASSPLIAATYALAGTPVGGSYPASYPYADPSALNDVVSGAINPGGDGTCPDPASPYYYYCAAVPGYDGPSGLGTPNGVAAFRTGPHGQVTGQVTDARTGRPVAGATVDVGAASALTDSRGRYQLVAYVGGYAATAAGFGYLTGTVSGVQVAAGGTSTANFSLRPAPMATVSGRVTDGSGQGWPLAANVAVTGTAISAYTDPVTGRYQLRVPQNGGYTLQVTPTSAGYQPQEKPVTVAAGDVTQDFAATVDTQSCVAPGYQLHYDRPTQTFDGSAAPTGWTVTDLSGGFGDQQWRFGGPAALNYTGGSGGYAMVDGRTALNALDSGLVTPPMDFTAETAPVLQFNMDLVVQGQFTGARVEISVDGGGWQSLQQWYSSVAIHGPDLEIVPLPQAAGHSHVQIRFSAYYFGGTASQGGLGTWEVDNVFVGGRTCQPVSGGGLVVGQVRDANTGQMVEGATVASGGQSGATATSGLGDLAHGGGYTLFSPVLGAQSVSTSAPGYASGSTRVAVAAGAVTRADLTLNAGRLAVTTASLSASAPVGGDRRTLTATVRNTGTAPATFTTAEQPGPFTVLNQPGELATDRPLIMTTGTFRPSLALTNVGARAATPSTAPAALPATVSWTSDAHYPIQVSSQTAATDPVTGLVYSAGGQLPGGSVLGDAFVFDPRANAWTDLPPMRYQRVSAASAVIGGKFYVVGGGNSAVAALASLEIYDPNLGAWNPGASMPVAAYGSSAVVLGGKLYVIGGCGGNGVCTSNRVQVYDPRTDQWSTAAGYPSAIAFESCGAVSGRIYCAGGFDHALGQGTAASYSYDPVANAWYPIANLPIDLWGSAFAAADGHLLVSGGVTRFDSAITNAGFAYDTATDTWSALPNAADATYRGASACGFYAIGGADTNGYVAGMQQLPAYGGCGGGGVGWLSASPTTATLAPGQATTVTVTLDAGDPSITQPGTYQAVLRLDGNTPYPPVRTGVTLTATPPRTWGQLAGTVLGRNCDGSTIPLAGATVSITGKAGGWSLTTDRNGHYGIWLDRRDNPLTLIVTGTNWLGQTKSAAVKPEQTTTVNATLGRAGC